MAKKRERLDVINDILKTIRNSKKIKPTRLLYASNLSPQMFKEYTKELVEKKFIEKKEKMFSLTDKGFTFLAKYKEMSQFIEDFGL